MKRFLCGLLLGMAFPGVASSAVLERMSLEEMSREADLVVIGTVVSRSCRYDAPPRADRIVTDVVVRVDRLVRGEAGDTVVVTTPGGEVEGRGQIVTGAPVLRPGEEVVLFLRTVAPSPTDPGAVMGTRRVIVGLSQGLFVVRRDGPDAPARARQRLSGVLFVGEGEGPDAEMDLDLEDLIRAVRFTTPVTTAPRAVPDTRRVR